MSDMEKKNENMDSQQSNSLSAQTEKQENAMVEASTQRSRALNIWADKDLLAQTFNTARFICKSALVPENYRNSPENCLIAIDLANRMDVTPLMVMQNLYIVKGKPAWSGAFCAASINGSGRFSPLEFEFVGERGKPSFGCYATAVRFANGKRCFSDTVTIQMAQDEGWLSKPGSKWKTMPVQMMMYRAASFFAKAHCPDILFGLPTQEEVQDVHGYDANPVTPSPKISFDTDKNPLAPEKVSLSDL